MKAKILSILSNAALLSCAFGLGAPEETVKKAGINLDEIEAKLKPALGYIVIVLGSASIGYGFAHLEWYMRTGWLFVAAGVVCIFGSLFVERAIRRLENRKNVKKVN